MVIRDYPKANQFIEEFSKVYRYVLGNQEKDAVTLRQELNFIESYVYLLNVRFGQGINVEIATTPESLAMYIIPVALQMLLENAIKHNSVSDARPLSVIIYSEKNTSIVIRNNIQRRQVIEPSSQIGLDNIRKRYELLTGIEIEVSETSHSFEVRLPLLTINQTTDLHADSYY